MKLKITNIIRLSIRKRLEEFPPIIYQLIKSQKAIKENKQSYYDHTKDSTKSMSY